MGHEYEVKDVNLAKQGHLLISWAEDHMPVLIKIRKRFEKEKPLDGTQLGVCLHVTKETAALIRTLVAGGAKVALCGSNPLSTNDEVAAGLADDGINVFAWRGQTKEEYYNCIEKVLRYPPKITVDDGADIVATLHDQRKDLLSNVVGGMEETTTGVKRLKAMASAKALKYPIIAVNNAYTKYLFDNRYGTGQSAIDGILRATSLLLAGTNFVVAGYGWCSRGIAMRARGMGANVIVTEVDPIKALEARMDGFSVMPMADAAKVGNFFVTATGNINVITGAHLKNMKDGAILANSGHFNVEISIPDLESLSKEKRIVRPNVEEYILKDGRKLYLLCEGRLVNLGAAEGHPPEVMMMSFADQALCVEFIVKHWKRLKPKVYDVPETIDSEVARLALDAMGIKIDELSKEQKRYLSSWKSGT